MVTTQPVRAHTRRQVWTSCQRAGGHTLDLLTPPPGLLSPAAGGSWLPADLILRRRPRSFPSFLQSGSRQRGRWLSAEASPPPRRPAFLVPCPR